MTQETAHDSKGNGMLWGTDLRPVCLLLKEKTDTQLAMQTK